MGSLKNEYNNKFNENVADPFGAAVYLYEGI